MISRVENNVGKPMMTDSCWWVSKLIAKKIPKSRVYVEFQNYSATNNYKNLKKDVACFTVHYSGLKSEGSEPGSLSRPRHADSKLVESQLCFNSCD